MLTLLGCDDEKAQDLSFKVSFACEADHDLADTLTLRVVRDGCGGEETVYDASLAKGEQASAANGIAPGKYGLEASAYSNEALVATGCIEATLPRAQGVDSPAIVLRSESCDAPPDQDAGQPGEDASSGGGLDAANLDAANLDGAQTCSSDCSDPFPCTEDRCVNGECVHNPFTGMRECDDVVCTQGDRCEMGTCHAGAPNNAACPDDKNPCTTETCEAETGCNRQNAEGAACNDQVGCTTPDTCKSGMCRGTDSCTTGGVCSAATGMCTTCTAAADCDDHDPCTNDSCAAGACQHVNNTSSCNDGKSCTNNDVCNNRICAGTSTCPADATCGGSTCRCNDTSKALCSNACVTLASSNQNCGQCGRVCANGGACQNSACKPSGATNCTAYRFGGHDYLLCNDTANWSTARDRCRSYGFGLAIVDSQAENDFLRTRPNAIDRWFAANDRGDDGRDCKLDREEGTWYWTDPNSTSSSSENFKLLCAFSDRNAASCTLMTSSYQNWHSGEPNNEGCSRCVFGCEEGEDCGVFNADGSWSDAECNSTLAFICETP